VVWNLGPPDPNAIESQCGCLRLNVNSIRIKLQLDQGQPVPRFRVFMRECLLVDALRQPHVEQPVLLLHEVRLIT